MNCRAFMADALMSCQVYPLSGNHQENSGIEFTPILHGWQRGPGKARNRVFTNNQPVNMGCTHT